jgi:hypothetical protein
VTNTSEYWKRYYNENKEKILTKNRAWLYSDKGKEYQRKRRHTKLLTEKPNIQCKVCGKLLDKLTKQRDFCSRVCAYKSSNRARYYRIKADPVKYAKRLEQIRSYRVQHNT